MEMALGVWRSGGAAAPPAPLAALAAAGSRALPGRPPSARRPAPRGGTAAGERSRWAAAACVAASAALWPAAAHGRRSRRRATAAREEAAQLRGHGSCGGGPGAEERPPQPHRRGLLAGAAAALSTAPRPPVSAEQLPLSAEALARARGKVVVITGATAGVGLEASRQLLSAGADVYVTGRSLQKAEAAAADVSKGAVAGAGRAVPMELNMASLQSVRRFASTWAKDVKRPIDILACNAGLALGQNGKEPQYTEDGFELTVGTNHLGHFLLVDLLKDQLSPTARIVVTASSVHDPTAGDPGSQATLGKLAGLTPEFGKNGAVMVDGGAYDPNKAYKDSKLCNVLFTLELARRLKNQGSQVTANCLSPGLIPSASFFRYQDQTFSNAFGWAATNILRIAETPQFGGSTLVFMGLDPSLDGRSGLFYSAVPPGQHIFKEVTPSPEARDEAEAAELWRRTAKIVGA